MATARSVLRVAFLLMTSHMALTAPVAQSGTAGGDAKSDVPVLQLENLKTAETKEVGPEGKEHLEFHRLDAVKSNGELVSQLEQHGSVDKAPGATPRVHAQAQLDVPSEGVHRTLVQDGGQVVVQDATTAPPSEEQTTKVFHGAARLIQAGSSTNTQPNGHTAARRSFNADLGKETNFNTDHFSQYYGVQYSPLDMAEYVFWTGDERGVTAAIEEFLQDGTMSKEEAISFLQEIKYNIDYLRAHYAQNPKAVEASAQQEKLRALLMDQANPREYNVLPSFPFSNSQDIIRAVASRTWELNNNLSPMPTLPVSTDLRPEASKRFDSVLHPNGISTPDYERDGASDDEYEEAMDKLRAADSLYTEYKLQEIIYQLAKMMFSRALHDPAAARAITQKFFGYLEAEAERGQLSRGIEMKVLDVMMAALTDTISEHPEILQGRDAFPLNIPTNRFNLG